MKKNLIKIISTGILWSAYGLIYKIFYPITNNSATLLQMEDSNVSLANYKMFQMIWDYSWIVVLLITLLIFKNNIKSLLKKEKVGNKNEE